MGVVLTNNSPVSIVVDSRRASEIPSCQACSAELDPVSNHSALVRAPGAPERVRFYPADHAGAAET